MLFTSTFLDSPQQMFGIGPPPPVDCRPGLEYLAAIDQLLVKQKIELLEGKSVDKLRIIFYNYLCHLFNSCTFPNPSIREKM